MLHFGVHSELIDFQHSLYSSGNTSSFCSSHIKSLGGWAGEESQKDSDWLWKS